MFSQEGKALAVMATPASTATPAASETTTTGTSGGSSNNDAPATRVQPEAMTTPQPQRQRKQQAPKQAAREEQFDVNEYIEEVADIQFEDLTLDTHLRLGQTRKVDDRHVLTLLHEFELNPPHQLELTTWLDQSM